MTDTWEQSYGEEAGGACRMDESTDQSRRIVTQDESTRKGSQFLAREAGRLDEGSPALLLKSVTKSTSREAGWPLRAGGP